LDEIEREAQTHPDYADLQNQLALLLMSEGEMEKAEPHFLKALHLNPQYREAILNLGFLYMEMGRWKGAEEIFSAGVKRHPKDGFIHHVLGILSLQTGRVKEAMAHIRKAIQYHTYFRDYYKQKEYGREGGLPSTERQRWL
jgi:superkiller protein 3